MPASLHEVAAIIARLIPDIKGDSVLNNTFTVEGILKNHLKPQCMYCGEQLIFENEEGVNKAVDHITTCEKSPLVQAVKETTKFAAQFLAKVEKLVEEKAIAVDNLTKTQLADAICQAIQCGDFTRYLVRGEDRQQVVYIPFQKEQELRHNVKDLCDVVEANHKWHQDYDEHGGYPDSELCDKNVNALKHRFGL